MYIVGAYERLGIFPEGKKIRKNGNFYAKSVFDKTLDTL